MEKTEKEQNGIERRYSYQNPFLSLKPLQFIILGQSMLQNFTGMAISQRKTAGLQTIRQMKKQDYQDTSSPFRKILQNRENTPWPLEYQIIRPFPEQFMSLLKSDSFQTSRKVFSKLSLFRSFLQGYSFSQPY